MHVEPGNRSGPHPPRRESHTCHSQLALSQLTLLLHAILFAPVQHELTIACCEDGSLTVNGADSSSSSTDAKSDASSAGGNGSSGASGNGSGLAVRGVELSGHSVRAEVDGQQLRAAWCLGR